MTQSNWVIDPTHSEIGFKVKHMMFTNVSGNFQSFSASFVNNNDDFETSVIKFEADSNSINTNNSDRDNHLRSADFFDSENYPKLVFDSTSIVKKSDNNYIVFGNLTIKEVTHQVELNCEYSGLMKDPWGNTKAGFSLSGSLNRKDYGLTWNAALETGGVLVSEEVKLNCEVQFIKQ